MMLPRDVKKMVGDDSRNQLFRNGSREHRLDEVEEAIPETRGGQGLSKTGNLPSEEEGVLFPLSSVEWEAHLETLPLATWIGDPDGGNVYVNRAYRRLLGVLSVDEVNDRSWEQHVHPDDRDKYVEAWDQFVQGYTGRFKETARWIRPHNGQVIRLAVRAQRLTNGQFQGWLRPATGEEALEKLEAISK